MGDPQAKKWRVKRVGDEKERKCSGSTGRREEGGRERKRARTPWSEINSLEEILPPRHDRSKTVEMCGLDPVSVLRRVCLSHFFPSLSLWGQLIPGFAIFYALDKWK
jgi:hypothetical protein